MTQDFLLKTNLIRYLFFVQTQNTVYEIVSDMSTRQDTFEERLTSLEDKLSTLQEQLELLPEAVARCLAQHNERLEQRRNFLHPDAAGGVPTSFPGFAGIGATSPLIHQQQQIQGSGAIVISRSASSGTSPGVSHHPWPASPVLPPVSSRTPHLVPETQSASRLSTQQQQQQQQQQQSDGSGRS